MCRAVVVLLYIMQKYRAVPVFINKRTTYLLTYLDFFRNRSYRLEVVKKLEIERVRGRRLTLYSDRRGRRWGDPTRAGSVH